MNKSNCESCYHGFIAATSRTHRRQAKDRRSPDASI